MGKILLVVGAVLLVVILGGGAFLMLWNVPAPVARVERVIPDARFPR